MVEDHADHVFATLKTQEEAIDWSRKNDHAPLVAGVRHLNDKRNRTTGGRVSVSFFVEPGSKRFV